MDDSLQSVIDRYRKDMMKYTPTAATPVADQAPIPTPTPTPTPPEQPEWQAPAYDDSGSLSVRVVTGSGSVPIDGAQVIISYDTPQGERLVRALRTNNDGSTVSVELPTYSRAASESIDGPADRFAKYNIYIDRVGYFPARSVGVPIFGGVGSTQTFELIPVPEYYTGDTTLTSENTEPNL